MRPNKIILLGGVGLLLSLMAMTIALFGLYWDQATFAKSDVLPLDSLRSLFQLSHSLSKEYFSYDSLQGRFMLIKDIRFGQGSHYMVADDHKFLSGAGRAIQDMMKKVPEEYLENGSITVLVEAAVPGNAHPAVMALAWKRAYAVQVWWQQSGVLPGKTVCEVKATATMFVGLRMPKAKWGIEQQRFYIYIIPGFRSILQK